MNASIRLVVTVTVVDSVYYTSPDRLAEYVEGWITNTLEDHPTVTTGGGSFLIERTECPQP